MTGDARQIIKEGTVTACFPEEHMARVEFEDKDGLVGAKMPILTMCAYGNKFYEMPDVGDKVVVLFASNADTTGEGWIIGSRFHDNSKPNAKSQDVTRLDFKDKTSIEYDRDDHVLKIEFKDKTSWKYDADSGKFQFKFKDGSSIKHDTNSQQMSIECLGDFHIRAIGNIFIDGATINLNLSKE